MGKYCHTTLYISDDDRARLEQKARELGITQTRGAGAGKLGSISALICAVARGDINLVRKDSQVVASNSESQEQSSAEVGKKGN